jgi:DNA-directed RNA polymerase specialized sigma24 family protein
MNSLSSVRVWISQLQGGDPQAARELWDTYFLRMVEVARCKLHGTTGRMADEEDVALSAFKSFCRGAQEGRFAEVLEYEDPWPLLLALTTHKAIDLVRHERRVKRGGTGKAHPQRAAPGEAGADGVSPSQLISKEPDPRAAFQLAEECQEILDRISDTILRAIALWKMEGFTSEEIAAKLGCTTRTVERKLRLIRRFWGNGDPAR